MIAPTYQVIITPLADAAILGAFVSTILSATVLFSLAFRDRRYREKMAARDAFHRCLDDLESAGINYWAVEKNDRNLNEMRVLEAKITASARKISDLSGRLTLKKGAPEKMNRCVESMIKIATGYKFEVSARDADPNRIRRIVGVILSMRRLADLAD